MADRGLEDVEVQNGSRSSPLTNMRRDPKLVDLEKQDAAGVVTKQLQQQQTPVSLTWSNLSVTVSGRAGSVLHGQHARLLHNSTGYAEAGSITAIMGPSGSGKSTLLNAIAGRLSPNTVMTGKIMLNGQSKSTLAYGLAVRSC
jgi:ABC-type transport system involved in cytochrome bd biosynthesis fused ATPase/permease subunit